MEFARNDKTYHFLRKRFTGFLSEADAADCLVTNVKEEEWIINHGTVRRKLVDGYSLIETDEEVPMDVVGKTRTFTVALPDGTSVMIPEGFVNMR